MATLQEDIAACRICADRFAATRTAHVPRPVPWFGPAPRIVVAGQAPGMRVHEAGKPFFDRSGDRLRAWMGIESDVFYDRSKIAVWPAAFCFPGYDARGADLPPPPVCWQTWGERVEQEIGTPPLMLLIGSYAIRNHLGLSGSLGEIVSNWRDRAPSVFVLPHPSWRNNGWLRKHPWFETDILPAMRAAVIKALA